MVKIFFFAYHDRQIPNLMKFDR